MKHIILICLLNVSILFSQQNQQAANNKEWTGAPDQKIWGLMTVWAQTKFAFPHTEILQEINWDEKVQEFIPRVLEVESLESYYLVLMELVALLKDSHTYITPPWGRMTPGYDIPPVEILVIDDKFLIGRVGESDEMKFERIYPGLEILQIDNVPVREFFNDKVLKYYTRGSKQADEAVLIFYILYGPKEEKVRLKIKDTNGSIRTVELSRNSKGKDNRPFLYRFIENVFTPTIQSKILDDGILYINIPNFQSENQQVYIDFQKLIDTLNVANIKGLIVDVRYNMGGSDAIVSKIVSCLIDTPVKSPANHYFHYVPANIPWGKESISWTSRYSEIVPRDGMRYLGPLVVLTGPTTHSSAEDFVIELKQTGRTIIVGEKTSGGAGGKLTFILPGGGEFALSTFKATYPDGGEYIRIGIQPDVEVHLKLDDIINRYDSILEKGIEVINNWTSFLSK
ncbi:S41 family peptidase [candidate division KSB1 bacterium]|nr:S41 family peptidase [candidate division KSB1 bacterium]